MKDVLNTALKAGDDLLFGFQVDEKIIYEVSPVIAGPANGNFSVRLCCDNLGSLVGIWPGCVRDFILSF